MMTRLGWTLSILLCALPARAQPAPSLPFTAFLKFCADPNMTQQSIRKAVESAGGIVVMPETKLNVFNGVTSNWKVTIQDHEFQIGALTSSIPIGHNTMQEVVGCNFIGDGGDIHASQSELKQWVSVAPDSYGQVSMPGMEIVSYHFEWDGKKRIPMPDGDAGRTDEEAGKVWRLIVSSVGNFTRVRLERTLKATPKP